MCVNSDARVPCWGIHCPWCDVHFQGFMIPLSLSVSWLRWQTSIVSKFWQKSARDILMGRERRWWSVRHLNQSEQSLNMYQPISEEKKNDSPELAVFLLDSLHTPLLFSAHHIPLDSKHTHYTNKYTQIHTWPNVFLSKQRNIMDFNIKQISMTTD